MEIQIGKDFENKLFGRREISFSLSYTGKMPTKEEVKQELCKKLSLNPELTLIVKISPLFGTTVNDGLAHTYVSKEMMNVEQKYLFERKGKKDKKAGAQAQAPAPEAKAEPKNEAKKEEKKEEKAEAPKE